MTTIADQPQDSPAIHDEPPAPPKPAAVCRPRSRRGRMALWPNHITIIPARMKHYVLGALDAGADDGEIAETTGLELRQVAAIREHYGISAVVIS